MCFKKPVVLPVSIPLIYYGLFDGNEAQQIIAAHPKYLVSNSPAGPWKGDADIKKFTDAGIKYFEYLDGGYEGTLAGDIPNDLQSNLKNIQAVAAAGGYGFFLDQVSSNPDIDGLAYLNSLQNEAHRLKLRVVFNVGVSEWADTLMSLCDFVNSSEEWQGEALSESQVLYRSRTWLLTQGVNDANTAANLTETALSKGIDAHYACDRYTVLPAWLADYVALLKS